MKRPLCLALLLAAGITSAQELQTQGFSPPVAGDLPTVELSTTGIRTIRQGSTILLSAATPNLADALPVTTATIEYFRQETSGTLTPIFGTATAAGTHLVAVHTFCKYLPVRIGAKTYAFGIKTYIRADYTVKSGSTTLSLFGIGAAASANKIQGTIQVAVSGISGPKINDYISMPAKLDETTITKALEDFAVIKSKLYDADTHLTLMYIGVLNP